MFFWDSCFLDDPTDVGNLISGPSAFSKSCLEHLEVHGSLTVIALGNCKFLGMCLFLKGCPFIVVQLVISYYPLNFCDVSFNFFFIPDFTDLGPLFFDSPGETCMNLVSFQRMSS